MRKNLVQVGLSTMAIAILFTMTGMSPPAQKPKKSKKLAEIKRLQKELNKALNDRSDYKKQLAEAEATIEGLRKENARLRKMTDPEALAYVRRDASEQLLGFYQWLAKSAAYDLTTSQQRTLLGLLGAAMDEWALGDPDRLVLVSSSLRWLTQEVESLGIRAAREVQSEPSNYTIAEHAPAICKKLQNKGRGQKAKAIATLLGQEVSWVGIVVETVDSRTAPYQLELDCEGVAVFVNIIDKRSGSMRGIKMGTDVYVMGKIADIGDTLGACVSVLLVEADVCDTQNGITPCYKKRTSRRR